MSTCFRSRRLEVLCKKGVPKIFANSIEKHLRLSPFFNKVTDLWGREAMRKSGWIYHIQATEVHTDHEKESIPCDGKLINELKEYVKVPSPALSYFSVTSALAGVYFWGKFYFVSSMDYQKIKFGPTRNRKSWSRIFIILCNRQNLIYATAKLNSCNCQNLMYVTAIN